MADNKLFGAILLASIDSGRALAQKLSARGIDATVVESSDALCQSLKQRRADFLVIQQLLDGFLTGLEIVERLQADPPLPATVLVGKLASDERKATERLGVRSVVESETQIEELEAAVVSQLPQLAESRSAIPQVVRRPTTETEIVSSSSRLLKKLRGHLQDVTLSIPEIVKDISDDPYATAELLRIANSVSTNSSRKVVSVYDAVVRLGIRQTIATVLIADQTKPKLLTEPSSSTRKLAETEFSQDDESNALVADLQPLVDSASPAADRRHRVMVIDDDAQLAKTADRMLSMAGFDVVTCLNPDEALANSEGVDIVLCDVHLENTTGMELIRRLRENGVDAPVIMISGDRTRETVVDCIKAGIVDYIMKPFSRSVLVGKVTAHLLGEPSPAVADVGV